MYRNAWEEDRIRIGREVSLRIMWAKQQLSEQGVVECLPWTVVATGDQGKILPQEIFLAERNKIK